MAKLSREDKQNLQIKFDFNNMMNDFLGDKEGISIKEVNGLKPKARQAFNTVMENRGKGMQGFMLLPTNQTEIVKDILETAKQVRKKFENFVVLGIGGSALGPTMAFNALCHLHHNDLKKSVRKAPKFYVEDNVDPERMQALLDIIDVEKTMFNVVTKSGATSETMSQYLIITDILKKKLGDKFGEHIIATTDESKGNLIKLAKENGFKTFFIPDGVGGRFSELCPVGLLPAAVLGIDIKQLLEGAKFMDELCKKSDIAKNPALMASVLSYISIERGKNISVMMPYADSLKYMSDWYCQLWGESLGKAVDLDGNYVYAGQTPVKALGVTDQHSQIQLYTEGPFDKVITFIGVENYRIEFVIPEGCQQFPDVHFLCGKTMNQLINAERVATEYALTKAERANNTILLKEVNAFTIGQLIYFFEMQTAFTGALYNIDTFNQPGVEAGKNATYALLGKSGYEQLKDELENATPKKNEYII